jgi:hypothetical protein
MNVRPVADELLAAEPRLAADAIDELTTALSETAPSA